jgi:hypothetical protein
MERHLQAVARALGGAQIDADPLSTPARLSFLRPAAAWSGKIDQITFPFEAIHLKCSRLVLPVGIRQTQLMRDSLAAARVLKITGHPSCAPWLAWHCTGKERRAR